MSLAEKVPDLLVSIATCRSPVGAARDTVELCWSPLELEARDDLFTAVGGELARP